MSKKAYTYIKTLFTRILINRFTRDKGIRTKLIIYFLVFIILPLDIMGITLYSKTRQTI